MKISVVIPAYNRGYIISRAIQSVLNQTYPVDEIIVVDDGSTDNTQEVLSQFTNELQIIRLENEGVSAARNAGINLAKNTWIALLDSDDEWLPQKIENHIEFLKINPQLLIFQCEEIWIRNGKRVNPRRIHTKYHGWIFKECLPLCIVSPSATIFKKELWEEMNGFDESFPVCEDYDLWLRVSRKYAIGLDPKPAVLKYGGHKDQLSTTFPVMDKYRIKAIEKHLFEDQISRDYKKAALREIIKKLKIVIRGAQKRDKDISGYRQKLKKYQKMYTE